MKALGNEQAAYLAGFLDGDGCIASNFERSNAKKSMSYRVRIRISFTQITPRRAVLDTMRGWIESGVIADYEHNSMSEYVIRDQQAVGDLLQTLLPYLIVKKRHAELALEILTLKEQRYSVDSLEQMKERTSVIRSLNRYPKRTAF